MSTETWSPGVRDLVRPGDELSNLIRTRLICPEIEISMSGDDSLQNHNTPLHIHSRQGRIQGYTGSPSSLSSAPSLHSLYMHLHPEMSRHFSREEHVLLRGFALILTSLRYASHPEPWPEAVLRHVLCPTMQGNGIIDFESSSKKQRPWIFLICPLPADI